MVTLAPTPWKVRLVVPHAAKARAGLNLIIRRYVEERGYELDPKILPTDVSRHLNETADVGSAKLADEVYRRLVAQQISPSLEIEVLPFAIARAFCDAGRLWGITPSVETPHLDTLAIPAEIAGVSILDLPEGFIKALGREYRAYLHSIAGSVVDPLARYLVLEIHTFKRNGSNGEERPPAALLFTEHWAIESDCVDPDYVRVGISENSLVDTCDSTIVDIFAAQMERVSSDTAHNKPYGVPQGNISLRLTRSHELHRECQIADPFDLWRFPFYQENEQREFWQIDPATATPLGAPRNRLETLAIEVREDLIKDKRFLDKVARRLAAAISGVVRL
ncbi:MAG: hypothetical protein HQ596_07340 [Candidatus Saganbacteria bacterium]|nr:hypothetical protein [Candidatus Saganbacteria bacterium]